MKHQERVSFDLDGTICTDEKGCYALARPFSDRVEEIKRRHAAGQYIIIDSARGSQTGVDWLESTTLQLEAWGVPFHELHVGRKPYAHRYVDDCAQTPEEFFSGNGHAERWPDSYFENRTGNDPRRQGAFRSEFDFMVKHGVRPWREVCDVGCSTGELLDALHWSGPKFGMEISEHAKEQAILNGIRFDRHILNTDNYFDTVIFRGTIQHIPHPFRYMERAFRALKSGGHVAFLATPNTGSLVYRVFQELPVTDNPRNYWMPSAHGLANALNNFGFELVAIEYPYLDGGYARPVQDLLAFAKRLFFGGPTNFPFPGNMMNVIARRP